MVPYSSSFRGGFAQHVTQRGFGRGRCFSGAPDCLLYLGLLSRHAPACDCRVHAYVLMGNHVHLLLTASGSAGAAALMHAMREEYGWRAREAQAPGETAEVPPGLRLEEGSTTALIHTARHLLACMRYIELNPVRAGMVRRPADYRWSSYAANALGREDSLLSPHPHYLALGRDPELRRAAYRRSVKAILHRGP